MIRVKNSKLSYKLGMKSIIAWINKWCSSIRLNSLKALPLLLENAVIIYFIKFYSNISENYAHKK